MTYYNDDDEAVSDLPDDLLAALDRRFPARDRGRGYHSRAALEVIARVLPHVDDIDDVVETVLPYDGPHSQDSVLNAARVFVRSGRYLNNATQPTTAETTLEWASTIGSIVGNVKVVLYQLDQLLDQLAQASMRLAEDPTLYSDQTPYDYDPDIPREQQQAAREQWQAARHEAGVTTAMTIADLLRQIRPDLVTWDEHQFMPVAGLAKKLEQPHALAAQLGHDTKDEDDGADEQS
ncbi:MAG TPA: hypothetical protein VGL46_21450 [Pseudonocardiaceae bacterium]|jgi:hypothetical protein